MKSGNKTTMMAAVFAAGMFFIGSARVSLGQSSPPRDLPRASADADPEVLVWLEPVEAHSKPGNIRSSSVGTIVGNDEIILRNPANVWLEIRVGNWDPHDTGTTFTGWGASVEASGFTSALP